METDDLVAHLASLDIRSLSNDGLVTELEFAQRELADPATKGQYRDYQVTRVEVLTLETQRRQRLGETVGKASISPDFIRDLKQRVDIRDIFNWIGILVIPSGTGKEKYPCPAHPDWNPSGYIYVKDQTYHCFQCGAHGDVFDALMAFKGLSFLQAVDAVAGYLGVVLPKRGLAGKGCVAL